MLYLYLLTVSEMLLWRLTWRWDVFCWLGVWGEGERRCGSSICWLYQLGVACGFSVTRAVQEEDPADAELRLSEGSQEPAADRRQERPNWSWLERVSWGLHTGTTFGSSPVMCKTDSEPQLIFIFLVCSWKTWGKSNALQLNVSPLS